MTDTDRLNKLEALLWSDRIGNGLAIWPSRIRLTGEDVISFHDMGDEDGSNLGEELTEPHPTLRDAIDAL